MSSFIIESAIYQEAEVVHSTPNKATFRMVMQTVDEANQNRRMYPKAVMEDGLSNVKARMERKAFMGELDHPTPQGNHQFDAVRQSTVLLKEVSHYIKDYEIRGNQLRGEIETASTANGRTLLGLLRDKSGIGLSMRGMAELDRREDINVVKSPLMIIGYDMVSMPSHAAAVVDFNQMNFESLNLLTESNNMICTSDGTCYLPDFFDKLVETKAIQFFKRWV